MFDQIALLREFFVRLLEIDEAIVARAAAESCRFCGGPLHRSHFARKPRGGAIAFAGELFARRFSLCCGRDGCRKRATTPSVRFLGRRVYVGAAVVVASVVALVRTTAKAIQQATGIPARTTRRWVRWWRGPFTTTPVFVQICARLVPAVSRVSLPTSLLHRIDGSPSARLATLLVWLAPLTTTTMPEGSRLVRGAV